MKSVTGPLLLVLCLIASRGSAWAQLGSVTATGGWTQTVTASDLVAGAGSNLASQYDSSSSATTLSFNISILIGVNVRRVDVNWNSNLHLYARRSSSGSGLGSVSGGSVFQEITTGDQQLFSVYLLRNNITTQYRLTGLSAQVPPGNYSTTVIYTIVGL